MKSKDDQKEDGSDQERKYFIHFNSDARQEIQEIATINAIYFNGGTSTLSFIIFIFFFYHLHLQFHSILSFYFSTFC